MSRSSRRPRLRYPAQARVIIVLASTLIVIILIALTLLRVDRADDHPGPAASMSADPIDQ